MITALKKLFVLATLLAPISTLFALTFYLPKHGNSVVGNIQHVYAQPNERLYDIARKYQMGFYEMIEANPNINRHSVIPTDFRITIPSQFVLPNAPREGIVINLAELRAFNAIMRL